MKIVSLVATVLSVITALGTHPDNLSATTAVGLAKSNSDFVFVCQVQDEGTGGQTPLGYFKSYLVTYPETLHFVLVGVDLEEKIWIHYNSAEFPDVPKSGNELTFRKGDRFIAFLKYVANSSESFRVVRIDKIESLEKIKKELQ